MRGVIRRGPNIEEVAFVTTRSLAAGFAIPTIDLRDVRSDGISWRLGYL